MPIETLPEGTAEVSLAYLTFQCAALARARCPHEEMCGEMCAPRRLNMQLEDVLRVILNSQDGQNPRRARLR